MITKNNTIFGRVKAFDYNAKGYDQNCDLQYSEGKKTIHNAIQKATKMVVDNNLKRLRILDAGCGNGRTTIDFYVELRRTLIKIVTDIDINIVGMDISSKMLEMAEMNAELEGITSGKIVFHNKNIEELSEEDGYFDLIFSNFALHLCTPNIYKKLTDRLNKGGAIVINQGGKNSNSNFLNMALSLTNKEEFSSYFTNWAHPFFYPTKEEVMVILYAAGFTDIVVTEDELKDYNKNYNYKKMVDTYCNASLKVFLEPLPNDELKNLFEEKFRELCEKQLQKYKHTHRLYITATKA